MPVTLRNPARERLEAGELSLGVGLRLSKSVEIAKAMRTAGYDWLFIDLEHNAFSIDTAAQIATAALDTGVAPLVRVPNGEYALATRLLDNGAMGVVMPHVETAEEAREVVARLKYPPVGHRSVSSAMAQLDFRPVGVGEAAEAVNAAMLLAVMLESPAAIDNADAIAAVDGIDVVMIGTNDLCAEMGIPGQFGHERVTDAYTRVVAACAGHGKWAGMGGVYAEDLMPRYIGLGVRFVLCGTDLSFLIAGAGRRAGFVRGLETAGSAAGAPRS